VASTQKNPSGYNAYRLKTTGLVNQNFYFGTLNQHDWFLTVKEKEINIGNIYYLNNVQIKSQV